MWKILGGLLLYLVEPIIAKVAGAFTFGLVSYTGIKIVFEQLDSMLVGMAGSIGHDIYAILSLMGFGDVLAINMAALLIRSYLDGVNSTGSMIRSRFGAKD